MAFSQYIADAFLNWMRGTAFPSPPANLYASLHMASPAGTGANECTDATYARVAIPVTAASWAAPSSGSGGRTTSNTDAITFPALTAGVTISHVGLWDGATAGNFVRAGALTSPVAFTAGESPSFPAGALHDTGLYL